MAVTVKGFQGTISDVDMATQFAALLQAAGRTAADLAVTAVGGARTVNVAAGTSDHAFVRYASDAVQQLALTPPASGGKFYAIAINRQWSPTNTATLEAVDTGATTDGTIPTAIPVAMCTATPTWMRNTPGTAGSTAASGAHHVLAIVHVRAADTTLTVFDTRLVLTGSVGLRAMTPHGLAFAYPSLLEGGALYLGTWTGPSGEAHNNSLWRKNPTYSLTCSGRIYGAGAATVGGIMTDLANVCAAYPNVLALESGAPGGGVVMNSTTNGVDWRWSGTWRAWDSDWIDFSGYDLAGPAVGGATKSARYRYRAGRCIYQGSFVMNSGNSMSNPAQLQTPIPMGSGPAGGQFWGKVVAKNASDANRAYELTWDTVSSTRIELHGLGPSNAAGGVGSSTNNPGIHNQIAQSVPFAEAWAVGDSISWQFEFDQ